MANKHIVQDADCPLGVIIDEKLDHIIKSQDIQQKDIDGLYKTMRGHNGYIGMVAELAVIKQKVTGCVDANKAEEKDKKQEKNKEKWPERIAVAIVTGGSLWFLFDILPKIITMVNP